MQLKEPLKTSDIPPEQYQYMPHTPKEGIGFFWEQDIGGGLVFPIITNKQTDTPISIKLIARNRDTLAAVEAEAHSLLKTSTKGITIPWSDFRSANGTYLRRRTQIVAKFYSSYCLVRKKVFLTRRCSPDQSMSY